MKKRRIFLSIDLPEGIKKSMVGIQKRWEYLPIRWTRKENLHITLVFLGYLDDEEILETIKLAKETVKRHESFEISFKKVILGPFKRSPRMIWTEGESNSGFSELKMALENQLLGIRSYRKDKKASILHITLGRIMQKKWKELRQKPEIEENISWSFLVDSVDIMESILSKNGPDYIVLEKIYLK